jgi:hypothetical protein
MDYKHLITFILVFMIIQYLLLVPELNYYLNMVTDIQGYKFNFYKNEKNQFTIKNIFIFIIGYIIFCSLVYYSTIRQHKSLLQGLIYIVPLYFLWDIGLFSLFDKATYHVPVLLYDTLVVGGVGFAISQYLMYKYYNILKKYIPLLSVLYLLTMGYFFYVNYRYNPT